MTQEEKAKAYDNALEIAKGLYAKDAPDSLHLERMFPQLKESEDERMWKLIKKYAHYNISDMALETDHITREQLESWLEKQGEQILANSTKTCKDEQKHVDKVEPKFNVGYWVTCKEIDTALIVNITDDKYEVEFIDGNKGFPHIDYVDRLFSFWTIQNAKDGDVLYSPTHHLIWIYKDNEHYYACVNMNYVTENVATDGLISIPSDVRPATKDQREQLEKAMTDAGYRWSQDKKKMEKIEQKPAWSEEDMSKIQRICKYLDEAKKYYADITEVRECIDWLKSLRPQSTWKPSDEQIKAVRLARSFVTDDFGENPTLSDVLVELEKQLKKLTE